MPSPKRWFPVSHDLLNDPELRTFLRKCGERSLRTWLYILSGCDRSNNRFRMPQETLPSISRALEQMPGSVSSAVGELLSMGWIDALEVSESGWPTVVSLPKYTKYHRSREQHKSHGGAGNVPSEPIRTEPNHPNPPIAPPAVDPLYPKELKVKLASVNGHALKPNPRFDQFWQTYPERGGKKVEQRATRERFDKLTDEDQALCVTAAKHYAQWLNGSSLSAKDPKRFLLDGKGVEYWREHIEPPKPTNGNGHAMKPPPFPPKTDPIARGQWRNAYGNPRDYGYD